MKILTEGHKYIAANFENAENGQIIQFIEKVPTHTLDETCLDKTQLTTVADGTTNEELIEVLLNRLNYLQSKFPCRENACAITKLDEALLWLLKRTNDRIKRRGEVKQLA